MFCFLQDILTFSRPEEMYEKIIALNLSSNFYAIKYAIPYMQKKNWGRIVNVASVHGN